MGQLQVSKPILLAKQQQFFKIKNFTNTLEHQFPSRRETERFKYAQNAQQSKQTVDSMHSKRTQIRTATNISPTV